MSQAGIISVEGSDPQIPTQFDTDSGSAIPLANLLEVLGDNGITTSGSGNTVTISGINATAAATVGAAQIGVCAFDSENFTVTDGFVELAIGGMGIEGIISDDGLPAIEPDGSGNVTIIGGNGIVTSGQSPSTTLTISADTDVATTYTTDAGVAHPSINNLNVLGGTNINTAGVTNTITVNLDTDVLGLTDLTVDNLEVNGNTISSTDTNGDIIISPDGTGGSVITTDLTVGLTTQQVSITVNGSPIDSIVAIHSQGISDLGGFLDSRNGDTAPFGAHTIFAKSRGSFGSETIVQDGDSILRLIGVGYDGTDYAECAEMQIEVDGTPGSDDMPGRFVWLTSPDGTQVPIEGMRLDSSQVLTLANALTVPNGGTGATTLTDGGILLGSGTGAVTVTSQPTDGQLLIGSTGVDPVLGSLSSTGSTITITPGSGTINLETSASVATSYSTDSGSAVPALGVLTIAGGTLIDTAGATSIVTINAADAVVGSVASDSGTATPTSNSFSIVGTGGISTSGATSIITIDGSGITGGLTWNVATGSTQAITVNNGYFANYAGTLAFTLPATAAVGDTIQIAQMLASQSWSLAQNAGQTCYIGNTNTTTGAGGSLASTDDGDWIELVCRVADTDFQVNVKSGNITVV